MYAHKNTTVFALLEGRLVCLGPSHLHLWNIRVAIERSSSMNELTVHSSENTLPKNEHNKTE